MSIFWIALWVLVSTMIMGIFVWTTKALQDQKKAWKAFALKRGLNFRANGFFESAIVSGNIDHYGFYLASEERPADDVRGRKFVTMIQFSLPSRLPEPGVIGSGSYMDFVRGIEAKEVSLPIESVKNGKAIARTEGSAEALSAYFTPERARVLDTLIAQKGVQVLFLFNREATYLRLETSDPMFSAGQMEKLVGGVVPMLKVFL